MFTDLLWFVNWQTIYGISPSDNGYSETADTSAERGYHSFVLINSLVLIFLKVDFDQSVRILRFELLHGQ